MLSRDEVLRRFDSLRQATLPGGKRAPHKPLLVLWVLGRLQRALLQPRSGRLVVPYGEADEAVSPMIREFGPAAKEKHRAALPFFHLDGSVWHVRGSGELEPRHARLRDAEAVGELDADVEAALRADPGLLVEVARRVMTANFPESYVEPICAATGLELGAAGAKEKAGNAGVVRRRSAEFRERVLRAYDYACAVCGYDGQLGRDPVALEAAHVFWHSHGGPDEVTNGLALCALHHTLFDRGILGVNEARRVMVSGEFVARGEVGRKWVRELDGRELGEAGKREARVRDEYFGWHRRQVYRAA